MIVLEKEAKKMVCPMKFSIQTLNLECEGKRCMMWEYLEDDYENYSEGFCALAVWQRTPRIKA